MDEESTPVVLDFEEDLKDVLSKHGFNPSVAGYLIRDLDNLRETWPKVSVVNDNVRTAGAMGSETP